MSNTLNLGNGNWATKEDSLLGYNSENGNFKPLPFDFTRASSATVVNKDGLIETVGSGEPRIDFKDNTKGALLLEPSRSNIISQSERLDQWGALNSLTSESSVLSLDGINNSYQYIRNSSSTSYIYQGVNLSNQASYTASFFVKKENADAFIFDIWDASQGTQCRFEYNFTSNSFSDVQGNSTFIEDYGNGWYRIGVQFTSGTGFTGSYYRIYNRGLVGDILYVWGAQLEQGSYATSYIPTSGSAVTRVAEQGIDGGAGAPIFSNTSAVWFIDLERIGIDTDSDGSAIALRNSSFSQQIRLHFDQPAANIRFRDGVNSYATISTITGANTNVRKKLALRIDGSTLSTFSNGSKIGSDYTAPNSFNIDEVDFSSIGFKIHDMRFYNTALTDQELIALTQ